MLCPHCNKPIKKGITKDQKSKVFKLHKEGYSTRDIFRLTGVSPSSVSRILKEGRSPTSTKATNKEGV